MFKEGDKVYSILRGWGEVVKTDSSKCFPIKVQYELGLTAQYTDNGKMYSDHINPEIYHTEPVITVPKRRVEHKGWVAIDNKQRLNSNGTTHYRRTSFIYNDEDKTRQWVCNSDNYTLQEITYYTEE